LGLALKVLGNLDVEMAITRSMLWAHMRCVRLAGVRVLLTVMKR